MRVGRRATAGGGRWWAQVEVKQRKEVVSGAGLARTGTERHWAGARDGGAVATGQMVEVASGAGLARTGTEKTLGWRQGRESRRGGLVE